MATLSLTWDRTRHNPKVVIHTAVGSSAPTLSVNSVSITLYDPATTAYNSSYYYAADIKGDGSQWLITSPADSTVTTADTWDIADTIADGVSYANRIRLGRTSLTILQDGVINI